jgi:hypothetical protein
MKHLHFEMLFSTLIENRASATRSAAKLGRKMQAQGASKPDLKCTAGIKMQR